MVRPRPDVLIVAYGTPELLADALGPLGGAFNVHVIDNSLSDQVRAVSVAAGAEYVRPKRNLGFAAGVNLGLAKVQPGRDVLLLNPDARVEAEDVLRLQTALGHGVAATAPLLRRPDGACEPTTWPMPTPLQPWWGVVGRRRGPQSSSFLSGAVLMLSGAALARIGPFDERFFLYAEECDWQYRALRAGWTVREAGSVEARHIGAATSADTSVRERHFHGSAELFIRKWYGSSGWTIFRLGSLLSAARRYVLARSPDQRRSALRTLALYARGPASQIPRPVA